MILFSCFFPCQSLVHNWNNVFAVCEHLYCITEESCFPKACYSFSTAGTGSKNDRKRGGASLGFLSNPRIGQISSGEVYWMCEAKFTSINQMCQLYEKMLPFCSCLMYEARICLLCHLPSKVHWIFWPHYSSIKLNSKLCCHRTSFTGCGLN